MLAAIRSQPAYLLHSRPFRDSSLLLDLITRDHGRISAVARGVRNRKSKNRALLQPFVPLLVNLSGKSELKTLGQVETLSNMPALQQHALFAALYLNELLVRLLHKQEGDEEVFALYEKALQELAQHKSLEPVLRAFEIDLLEILGYGLDFSVLHVRSLGEPEAGYYHYNAEQGFQAVKAENTDKYYPADELYRIAQKDFTQASTLRFAKRLPRSAFAVHLGDKALASRSLFRKNS